MLCSLTASPGSSDKNTGATLFPRRASLLTLFLAIGPVAATSSRMILSARCTSNGYQHERNDRTT